MYRHDAAGGRKFQSDAREGLWAKSVGMSSAGYGCYQLGSQHFGHATKSFKAGLAAMRTGGLGETADVCDLDVYHLCMDGLLACQALGKDPSPNGYSYEGFKYEGQTVAHVGCNMSVDLADSQITFAISLY